MNPEQLERLAEYIVRIYIELETDMIENIAKRLADKKELLQTDPETWKLHQLELLGMLDDDNIEKLRDASGLTNEQLNSLLLDASLEGLEATEKEMEALRRKGANLATVAPITESPVMLAILEAYQRQARNVLNLTNQTLLDQSQQVYIDIINRAAIDVSSGYKDAHKALRDVVTEWSDRGIPALITRDGKRLSAEGYVRTVMRSTTNNMVNEMQDQRFLEYDVALIEVSSHAGARPLCAPYQGKVFSLKPDHPKYEYIGNTSIGQPAGLFGINCGHMKYPYVDGVSERTYKPYPARENARIYEESQRQRALEREIRKAKSRLKAMQALGDEEGIARTNALIRARQQRMRKFIDSTGRTRRYNREQIYA